MEGRWQSGVLCSWLRIASIARHVSSDHQYSSFAQIHAPHSDIASLRVCISLIKANEARMRTTEMMLHTHLCTWLYPIDFCATIIAG